MKSTIIKFEYFVSLIILVSILTKIQLFNFLGFISFADSVLVFVFFLSALLAILGMFLQKHWGYFSTYIFIMVSSIVFGIAPIPFVKILFPNSIINLSVVLTSASLFAFTLFLHIKLFINKPSGIINK
ncbi:MAG: hypothetical protein IPM56_01280 [Ignavibacteriales bacterium]|nr:MAG: hypothetical protein IPM56_01280 [Ignavibacteriales bacterium]